jgi:hypothetical protein
MRPIVQKLQERELVRFERFAKAKGKQEKGEREHFAVCIHHTPATGDINALWRYIPWVLKNSLLGPTLCWVCGQC